MQKTTYFTCVNSCNTEGLKIDKNIFQYDKVHTFELGKKYVIYGNVTGSKAIYENPNTNYNDDEYDDKFRGWVIPEFLYKNFVTDDDILEIDKIAKEIYENA